MRTTTETPGATGTACYHCGLDCPDGAPGWQDKVFCCQGCRAVFLLLSENGLTDYYQGIPNPGIRPTTTPRDTQFAALDLESVTEQLVDYRDGAVYRLRLTLPDIHCTSCVWLLENLYRLHPAVQMSRVNFIRRELTVLLDTEQLSTRGFAELLTRLGYRPDLQSSLGGVDVDQSRRRSLYQRLGVAAFCYANIMLFSFPEYLAFGGLQEAFLQKAFAYGSALLSLPVLFYAARDYLSSALRALRYRALNIDVPIALGMLALFGQSWYEVLVAGGSGYFDSLAGLTFFLLVGRLFQEKTYARLSFDRDYRSYFPLSAQRLTDTQAEMVPIGDLEPGDRVMIRNQEIIPADALLVEGQGLVDYSFTTGESEPAVVTAGERLFAGGRQTGAGIEIRITKRVSQSQLVSLWSDGGRGVTPRPHGEQLADLVARYFTAVVLLIAISTLLYWLVAGSATAIGAFTAVLIVACPCALALSSPFALGTAMRLLGRAGLLLRNTAVVERLAHVDTIVFDKTGTLAYTEERHVRFDGEPLTEAERRLVTSVARHSTHPVSRSISRYCSGDATPVEGFTEEVGKGVAGVVGGQTVRLGSRSWVGNAADDTEAAAALREGTWLSIDGVVRGRFQIRDRLRDGLEDEIRQLGDRYRLAVMSGDTDREEGRFARLFGADALLAFSQSPHDKRDAIIKLADGGRRVLMVGDGLNDAGALAAADVGMAVSENLSAFTPASHAILESNRLSSLRHMLKLARGSIRIVWLCYLLSFAYNVVGLGFAVTGQLSPVVASILMPLSSITVVVIATTLTRLEAARAGVH